MHWALSHHMLLLGATISVLLLTLAACSAATTEARETRARRRSATPDPGRRSAARAVE
jgi:hypothetical protein